MQSPASGRGRGGGRAGPLAVRAARAAAPRWTAWTSSMSRSPRPRSVAARASATAGSSSAGSGRSPGPQARTARSTSSVGELVQVLVGEGPLLALEGDQADIRTGAATRPAPGPSLTKSFLTSGATTPEASRTPTADGSMVRSALPRGRCCLSGQARAAAGAPGWGSARFTRRVDGAGRVWSRSRISAPHSRRIRTFGGPELPGSQRTGNPASQRPGNPGHKYPSNPRHSGSRPRIGRPNGRRKGFDLVYR